jgi:hypothetical protein
MNAKQRFFHMDHPRPPMTLGNKRKLGACCFITMIALVLLFITHTRAQDIDSTGNRILPGCKFYLTQAETIDPRTGVGPRSNSPYPIIAGYCFGTVSTLVEVSQILALRPDLKFCVPQGVTWEQAVRVVISYIEARPQDAHLQFTQLAMRALNNAWPCPQAR